MTRIPLLATGFLAACGMSEDKFKDVYAAESCRLSDECAADGTLLFDSPEECEAFVNALFALGGSSGCDYDAKAAKQCAKALQAADCESGDEPACEDVYGGEACALTIGGTSATTPTGTGTTD